MVQKWWYYDAAYRIRNQSGKRKLNGRRRSRTSGGGNEPQPATANGAPINYAPVYNFNGAAPTKDDLVEAERMSQAEFNEMMEQWQRDNDRKRF